MAKAKGEEKGGGDGASEVVEGEVQGLEGWEKKEVRRCGLE